MLTPRLRRFLLLVLGVAAFAAFTVLTPLRVWAGIMLVVFLAVLVGIFWWLAKEPFPWHLFRRAPCRPSPCRRAPCPRPPRPPAVAP